MTTAQIQERIALWEDAEASIASGGQEYTIDTGGSRRTLRRADLSEIRKTISYWEAKLKEANNERKPIYVAKNW